MKRKTVLLLIMVMMAFSIMPVSIYADESVMPEETTIPVERRLPRLVDNAFLLSEEEVTNLTKKLDEISERQSLDVVIITVDSIGDYTPTEFADDVYDYNGFGVGPDADGILFLISMEERDWAISTTGFGITAFTDAGQKYMVDEFIGDLGGGKYYTAFNRFADLCDDFITQARTAKPYDTGNLPKKPLSPLWIPASLVIGAIIAFISTSSMKSKLKTVRQQKVAANYLVASNVGSIGKDLYLYQVVTKTRRPKDEGSSGSSTHTSSSGRSHGGSSGKF